MRRLPGLLLVVGTLLPWVAMGEEIYRTKDAEGNVTFSDTPPAGDASVEPVELPPGPSAESLQQSQQRNKKIRDAARDAQRQRLRQKQRQQGRIAEAEARLAQAEAKLTKEKVITDEDRQSVAGGKRRIRPDYFERVKAAEAEVEAARKALRAARGY